jgi:hypothetical protein
VKIPSFGVAQHFADEVNRILDLAVSTRLPSFDDDSYTNHITCSTNIELQVFIRFQSYQSMWGCQVLLQVFKGLL